MLPCVGLLGRKKTQMSLCLFLVPKKCVWCVLLGSLHLFYSSFSLPLHFLCCTDSFHTAWPQCRSGGCTVNRTGVERGGASGRSQEVTRFCRLMWRDEWEGRWFEWRPEVTKHQGREASPGRQDHKGKGEGRERARGREDVYESFCSVLTCTCTVSGFHGSIFCCSFYIYIYIY